MAYTKTVWVDGSTQLSADNLNNIENGIESLTNQTLVPREALPTNTDLKDVRTSGVYEIKSSYTYTGKPSNVTSGIMLVLSAYSNNTNTLQCIFANSNIHFRILTSNPSSFVAWTTI